MEPAAALGLVEKLIALEFPDACAAFVGGYAINGEFNAYSDIDTVILRPVVNSGSRQVFCIEGVVIEAFVQDEQTLRWYLDFDRARGRPVILRMVAEGIVTGTHKEIANRFGNLARQILASGPGPLPDQALDQLRYAITDRLDDLRVQRARCEQLAIASELYPLLAEIMLRGHGRWFGAGKWIPRLLGQLDPALHEDFTSAFEKLFQDSNADAVIIFAERELAGLGGLLLVGSSQFAPVENRIRESLPYEKAAPSE